MHGLSSIGGLASLAIVLSLVVVSVAAAQEPQASVDGELAALAGELERARFETVRAGAAAILERSDLAAAERIRALELRAVAEIALRRDRDARETLGVLYRRDPGHRLAEISGPDVAAAFDRAREEAGDPLPVRLSAPVASRDDGSGTPRVAVTIDGGADAVDELRLSFREPGRAGYSRLVMDRASPSAATARVPAGSTSLECFVEALAPSGRALAAIGSSADPIALELPAEAVPRVLAAGPDDEPGEERRPIARAWWLWTTLALAVGGGLTAFFLAGPPSDRPERGSLGQGRLR